MKFSVLTLAILMIGLRLPAAEPPAKPSTNELIRATLDKARREMSRRAYGEAVATTTSVLLSYPKSAEAMLLRGQAHEAAREHEKAVADFTEFLKLEPDSLVSANRALVLQHRGLELFKLARAKEAAADFDKFLALMPSQAAQHWQRGLALYYAGRFEDGRKQFELHQTVNPNDVENAVWHFLCVARGAGMEKARASLIEIKGDPRVPMAQIHALFAGKGTTEDVLKTAQSGKVSPEQRQGRLFYAHLYLALYHEAAGSAKLAEEHLLNATGPYAQEDYMGDVARVHLKLLKARKTD